MRGQFEALCGGPCVVELCWCRSDVFVVGWEDCVDEEGEELECNCTIFGLRILKIAESFLETCYREGIT